MGNYQNMQPGHMINHGLVSCLLSCTGHVVWHELALSCPHGRLLQLSSPAAAANPAAAVLGMLWLCLVDAALAEAAYFAGKSGCRFSVTAHEWLISGCTWLLCIHMLLMVCNRSCSLQPAARCISYGHDSFLRLESMPACGSKSSSSALHQASCCFC